MILSELGYRTKPLYRKGIYAHQSDRKRFGVIKLIDEKISYVFDKTNRGGVITLSTDVNAIYKDDSQVFDRIKDWLDAKLKTLSNRMMRKKKVSKVIEKVPEVTGFTVGNFMNGRYIDEVGRTWDEKSFSIEIIGIEKDVLDLIATQIAEIFSQESVLVKSYETGDIYFVEQDKSKMNEMKKSFRIERISDILNSK